MRINLATILQRCQLKTDAEYILEPFFSFNTRPKNGLPMQVYQRYSNNDTIQRLAQAQATGPSSRSAKRR